MENVDRENIQSLSTNVQFDFNNGESIELSFEASHPVLFLIKSK